MPPLGHQGNGTNKWHFVLAEHMLMCDGAQSSSSTLSRKKKLHLHRDDGLFTVFIMFDQDLGGQTHGCP